MSWSQINRNAFHYYIALLHTGAHTIARVCARRGVEAKSGPCTDACTLAEKIPNKKKKEKLKKKRKMEASEVVGFTGRSRGGCESPGRSNKRGVSFKAIEQPPPPPPPAGASALDNASQFVPVHANFHAVTWAFFPSSLRTYLRGSAPTSILILRPKVSFKPGWLHPVKSLAPIYRLQLLFVRQHTARPFQIPAHAAF